MRVDELMFKRPWLLTAIQWLAIGTLSASAVIDATTDHGILMAINCFCLGVVFFSMLCQKMITKTLRDLDGARDGFQRAENAMRRGAEELQRAVESGQVEIWPIQTLGGMER